MENEISPQSFSYTPTSVFRARRDDILGKYPAAVKARLVAPLQDGQEAKVKTDQEIVRDLQQLHPSRSVYRKQGSLLYLSTKEEVLRSSSLPQ